MKRQYKLLVPILLSFGDPITTYIGISMGLIETNPMIRFLLKINPLLMLVTPVIFGLAVVFFYSLMAYLFRGFRTFNEETAATIVMLLGSGVELAIIINNLKLILSHI